MQNNKEELLQNKIKALKQIHLSLAEFEYLYDPDPTKEGQIDPNALSAGCFPITALNGIFELLHEKSLQKPVDENNTLIRYSVQQVQSVLRKSFSIKEKDIESTAQEVVTYFFKHLAHTPTQYDIDLLIQRLTSLKTDFDGQYDPGFISNDKILLQTLFSSAYGLGYIDYHFWQQHKNNLITLLLRTIDDNEKLGPFSTSYLKKVIKFAEVFIDGMQLDYSIDDTKEEVLHSYKVAWESNLGYLAKYFLEQRHPNLTVKVFIDLHAKTDLFSLIPFESHTILQSNSKTEQLYSLIRNYITEETEDNRVYKLPDKEYPYIVFEKSKSLATAYLRNGTQLRLRYCESAKTSRTKNYDQYAYLFDSIPKKHIELENYHDRKMVLSSIMNAKSALYGVYESMEEECKEMPIAIPPYFITTDKHIRKEDIKNKLHSNHIVIKEGGYCSTGGSEVDIIDLNTIQESFIPLPYEITIVQEFIPSHFFKKGDTPIHGHVRNISLLDSKGNHTHFGYVIKLTHQGKGNSSAYVSSVLLYDDQGTFLYGKHLGTHPERFFSLEESGFSLHISEDELQALFSRARFNWLASMYRLNAYFEEDFKQKINALVAANKASERYYLG